jgi:hypothetical protein
MNPTTEIHAYKQQSIFIMNNKYGIFFFALLTSLFFSCSKPRLLLKDNVQCDTLKIYLGTNTIQQLEYKQAIERKARHYVNVYNTEKHPFILKLVQESTNADCKIEFIKTKFVSRQKNIWATVISTVGIATPAILIGTQFFLPVGWIYIPNARTTIKASLSPTLTNITEFPSVSISSSGMYRKQEKQIELQSTKVIKYLVEMIFHVENEYQLKKVLTPTYTP